MNTKLTHKLTDQELLTQLRTPQQQTSDPIVQTVNYLNLLKELMFNRDIAFDNEAMAGIFMPRNEYSGSYESPLACLRYGGIGYDTNPYKPKQRYVFTINFGMDHKLCGRRLTLGDMERGLGVALKPHLTRDINHVPIGWIASITFKRPEYKFYGALVLDLHAAPNLAANTVLPETTVIDSVDFDRSIWLEDNLFPNETEEFRGVYPSSSCPATGMWYCDGVSPEQGIYMRKGDPMPGQSYNKEARAKMEWHLIKPMDNP